MSNKISRLFEGRKPKSISMKAQSAWIAVIAAAGILLLTFALQFVFNQVFVSGQQSRAVDSWSYVYGHSHDAVEGAQTLEEATAVKPLPSEKAGSYLRLSRAFPASEEDTLFSLSTDHSPMKILLDGVEIYNNRYRVAEYTGNCLNAVVIPSSPRTQTAEVYIYLPYSAALSATVTEGGNVPGLSELVTSPVLIFAALLILAGLGLMLAGPIIRRNILKICLLGLTVLVFGVGVAVREVGAVSYLLNDPLWYNIEQLFTLCGQWLLLLNLALCFGCRKKAVYIFAAASAVAAAAQMFATQPQWIILICTASLCLSLAGAAALAFSFFEYTEQRLQFARGVLVLLFYGALLNLFRIWTLFFGTGRELMFFEGTEALFAGVMLFIVFYSQSGARVRGTAADISDEGMYKWIDEVSSLVVSCMKCSEERDFLTTAAEGLYDIIGLTQGVGEEKPPLRACAAMRQAEGFVEIYNRAMADKCDYADLAQHFNSKGVKDIRYAATYIDIAFCDEKGVSAVFHAERLPDGLTPRFENIINTVGATLSIAYSRFHGADSTTATQESVFISLARDTEQRSGYTKRHLSVVADITRLICLELGFSDEDADLIAGAAMLHDIGKIAVPEGIVNKTTHLSNPERAIIKRHTEFGYEILSRLPGRFMEKAAVIARDHHEQFDGGGYGRLAGEDISIYARIVAVADVFDALTSARTYKEKWTFARTVKYINENSGKKFDPEVVEAFNRCLPGIEQIKNAPEKGDSPNE